MQFIYNKKRGDKMDNIKCNPTTKEECDKCAKMNDFPYDNCCLFECGSLEQCRGCDLEHGTNTIGSLK